MQTKKRGRPKLPRDFISGEKFEKINCPTCKKNYRRMMHDNEQIVCPRCLNKEYLDGMDS